MILVIGGKYEGEEDFIHKNWPERNAVFDFEDRLLKKIRACKIDDFTDEALNFTKYFSNHNIESVIFIPEISCGIIPLDPFERAFREVFGRCGGFLAEKASEVYYVTMGIGKRIK